MDNVFESIKKGLEEAVDYSQGKKVTVRVFHPEPVNVKSIRQETRLTQDEFAAAFGINVATLRDLVYTVIPFILSSKSNPSSRELAHEAIYTESQQHST